MTSDSRTDTLETAPSSAFRFLLPVAVMAGGFASLAPAMSGGIDQLSVDMATGAALTIAIAGVLGAVLAGIAQSAKVLDQRREHQAMHRMGVEIPTMRVPRFSRAMSGNAPTSGAQRR